MSEFKTAVYIFHLHSEMPRYIAYELIKSLELFYCHRFDQHLVTDRDIQIGTETDWNTWKKLFLQSIITTFIAYSLSICSSVDVNTFDLFPNL